MLTFLDTVSPPTIQVDSKLMGSNAVGILFMIDLDVPRNGTRMTNLHWLAPGVTNPNGTLNVPVPDANATPKVSNYLQFTKLDEAKAL